MNIQFECADKINGLMTITIEKADYEEKVAKTLKDYRKKAQMPGFRPGMVPMGLIKKQYGTAAKVDEVNRLLGEKLTAYIRDNKIQMLGEPLNNQEKQQPLDFAGDGPFEFFFDIAVAPEITAELTDQDTIDYYNIGVDDKMIDEQVTMLANQNGEMVEAEEWSGNDTLIGDMRELDAEGNTLEGGKEAAGAQIMPSYIKNEDEKKKFEGAKLGDIITFNPRKAYDGRDAELAALLKMEKDDVKGLDSDFSFQLTTIRHYQPASVDEKLFERVFGEEVKTEADFRQHISDAIKPQLAMNSDYKFFMDVRSYMDKKVGELTFPEELLKRVMKQNSKDQSKEVDEKEFAQSIEHLRWHLIREKLAEQTGIKVEDADVKAVAKEAIRAQFAQYGMANVPEDLLDNYAEEQLKKRENVDQFVDRAVDIKLIEALKKTVKLNMKPISFDDFKKMMDE